MKACLSIVLLLASSAAAFVATHTPAWQRGNALCATKESSFDRRRFGAFGLVAWSPRAAAAAFSREREPTAATPATGATKEKRVNAARIGGGNADAREERRQKDREAEAKRAADRAQAAEDRRDDFAELAEQRKAAQQDSIAKADAAFQKERAKVIATGSPKYSRGPVQSPEAAAKADPAGGAIAAAGGVKSN